MRLLGRYVFHIFALLMVVYFTLPMIVAVLMSFTPSRFLRLPTTKWSLRWYEAFFNDFKWMEGLWNSLIVSGITIVFALVVGMTAAIAFSRYKFKWGVGLYTLALTPVFTPAVIIAMALLAVAYKANLWGGYMIIGIAHSLWAFPLVIMILRVSLEGLDRSLEEASINEFIMALFLGTSETETLPRIIYPTLRYSLTPLVAAASGILMLVTVAVLLLAARLMNLRKLIEFSRD
jgi:ABC-type spermidine/putrescine transport system permease subunit II